MVQEEVFDELDGAEGGEGNVSVQMEAEPSSQSASWQEAAVQLESQPVGSAASQPDLPSSASGQLKSQQLGDQPVGSQPVGFPVSQQEGGELTQLNLTKRLEEINAVLSDTTPSEGEGGLDTFSQVPVKEPNPSKPPDPRTYSRGPGTPASTPPGSPVIVVIHCLSQLVISQ